MTYGLYMGWWRVVEQSAQHVNPKVIEEYSRNKLLTLLAGLHNSPYA